jgi:ubiquitin carboxyl-terminal hydrolase 22/27/51
MCCEMDKLFTEVRACMCALRALLRPYVSLFKVHSGNIYPYGPTTLLALTWRASEELAGYAQHDAHEFLIFALNRIHESARGSTKAGCNCIVHSVFAGALQSDQTCNKCGETTSKADPMFDVSLQLSSKDDDAKENTLYGCLRR